MFESTAQLTGNLVEDPDLKIFSNGSCLATFRLACNSRRFDRSQDRWVDGQTLFMRVCCWRQLAENVSASLRRGDRAVVVGRMRQNSYEARDGSRRTAYEVDADVIGVELTWQSVHVRRTNRGSANSTGPLERTVGAVPADFDAMPAAGPAAATTSAGDVPTDEELPGDMPAGDPNSAGAVGSYSARRSVRSAMGADGSYPTGGGYDPAAGAGTESVPPGPGGWEQRRACDDAGEPASRYEDAQDGFEPDQLESAYAPEVPA